MDFGTVVSAVDWRSIAGAVAPLAPSIGQVLGSAFGPFGGVIGGIAGNALAATFGVPATPEAVGKAIAEDPKAAEKLQQLEEERGQEILAAAQVQVERLKQDTAQLALREEGTQHAREAATGWAASNPQLSSLQRRLAYSFVAGFFLLLVLMITGQVLGYSFQMSEAIALMLGVLTGSVKDIVGFFFGSSAGSQMKDVAVREMANAAATTATTAAITAANGKGKTIQAQLHRLLPEPRT